MSHRFRQNRSIVMCLLGLISISVAAQAPEAFTVSMQTVEQIRVIDGICEAVNRSTVSAQVSGRIEKINFDVGDFVKKGDILIQLRDREVQAKVDSAKAEFQEANKELKRNQELFAKKLVASSALDKAQTRLKTAKAALTSAEESQENTNVRAPYSGIVVERMVQIGELANVGKPLMTGLSLESLRVVVDIPQNMVYEVTQRKQATVYGPGDEPIKAKAVTLNPYADSKTHTFEIRLALPELDLNLYPGMLVKVAFVVGEQQQLQIPLDALARRGELNAVYVRDHEGKITFRQVRIGQVDQQTQKVEVLAGLSAGEEILLDTIKAATLFKQQRK